MSAVSNRLIPAPMQMSTIFRASSTSVVPHALKNSLLCPPNVPHPKQSSGTFNPDRPSCLYSTRPPCLQRFRCSLPCIRFSLPLQTDSRPRHRRPTDNPKETKMLKKLQVFAENPSGASATYRKHEFPYWNDKCIRLNRCILFSWGAPMKFRFLALVALASAFALTPL